MKKYDTTTLDKIKIGDKCEVIQLNNVCTNSGYRLLDLGVVKSTRITALFKSMTSDTKAYLIKGSVIALRNKETQNIIVRLL